MSVLHDHTPGGSSSKVRRRRLPYIEFLVTFVGAIAVAVIAGSFTALWMRQSQTVPMTSFGVMRVSKNGEPAFFMPRECERKLQVVVSGDLSASSELATEEPVEAINERQFELTHFHPADGFYLCRCGAEANEEVNIGTLPRGEFTPVVIVRNSSIANWCERMLAPGSLLLYLTAEGEL